MTDKPLPHSITRLLNPTDIDRFEIIAWDLKEEAKLLKKRWILYNDYLKDDGS